jgi:hypothetical protein
MDLELFDKLPEWLTIGDVLAYVEWSESPTPDERYDVKVEWKFRGEPVGEASIIIEPIFETDEFRFFWRGLRFIDEWQKKGLYSEIVKQLPPKALKYGIVETVAAPWDKEAERRLASQGFEWRGFEFVLDFRAL